MYRQLIAPLLSSVDPEQAHGLSLWALSLLRRVPPLGAVVSNALDVRDPALATDLFGLSFKNPIGLAAGYDKTGAAASALACLGFSHMEIGTVTPLPQAGRARPRIFRLDEDEALINRIGFANLGAQATHGLLLPQQRGDVIRGLNIGPNAQHVESDLALQDYIVCFNALHDVADYFTLNISSPNTQGLRALHEKDALRRVLGAFFAWLDHVGAGKPVLIKVSPDLEDAQLADLVEVAAEYPVQGYVATNTTLERPAYLRSSYQDESGGLSGAPLRIRSLEVVRVLYRLTGGRTPIIGVGGVSSVADVIKMLWAGASLVQLYTGMVYQGPGLIRRLNLDLLEYLKREGIPSVSELVGSG